MGAGLSARLAARQSAAHTCGLDGCVPLSGWHNDAGTTPTPLGTTPTPPGIHERVQEGGAGGGRGRDYPYPSRDYPYPSRDYPYPSRDCPYPSHGRNLRSSFHSPVCTSPSRDYPYPTRDYPYPSRAYP